MSSLRQRPSAIAERASVPRDRDLVRLYWPKDLRPAFDALFDIDDAMGEVVVRATQPGLGAIKLAWWRERLQELDEGMVPAEPRLQAASKELLPRGIKGTDLAELETGWAELFAERAEPEKILERGPILFAMAARLLNAESVSLPDAGRLFAAGSLKRRSLGASATFPVMKLSPFPRKLRPLTALGALAKRDLIRSEPEGTPGRALALFRHRLTGRL